MGWLFMTGLGGHSSPRSYLDNQFTHAVDGRRSTVLASALVAMRTYYAAVEHIDASGETSIFAVICLVKFNPRASDGYIFGYKDMSETMGPCEADCPAAILDLLTPTDNAHAREWRARCRANLAAKSTVAARPTPRPGQTIIFDPPLSLSNGTTVAQFKVVSNPGGRGVRYRDPQTGALVRIGNVKRFPYRIINGAVSA